MVKEIIIPKTETVTYLNNEIPTYEEFMKTYQSNEQVKASYESENDALEKGYGPCTNSYCSCSSYELRQQLRKKQEDLDSFWEKFKEYDRKWEEYKSVVDNEESVREKKEEAQKLASLATEFIPIPFIGAAVSNQIDGFYDMSGMGGLAAFGLCNVNKKESVYNQISKKYEEIKSWYYSR